MKKVQKIALIFLLMLNIVGTASSVITGKKENGPRPVRPWEVERYRSPTDPVPDPRPSNRTGEPLGGFNEDIMSQTK